MCLCEYGCGLDAQYQLKNKRWCCSKSPNSCINIRKKNSATIKKLHAEGICVVGFNDTSKWWTYKSTEEVQQIYNKISITLKQKFKTGETKPSFLGKHHTEEVRSKISDARLKFLSQNKDFGIKWKKIKNILGEEISVQGTWEYAVAEWLNTNNIIFKRLPLIFQKIRKYTPDFEFKVNGQSIKVSSVQTEVDAGYEGENQVVLIEAKNSNASNTIIRQLFYPFKQWKSHTKKEVIPLFFDRDHEQDIYSIWQFTFSDPNNYNSIELVKSGRFRIH